MIETDAIGRRGNVGKYFNRPNLMKVRDLRRAGMLDTTIAKRMNIPWDATIFSVPLDDLHVDEIAVLRAMQGDRDVFEALRPLERQELGERLAQRPTYVTTHLAQAFGINESAFRKEVQVHHKRYHNLR